jgi:glycosyltransferase involved in cell wall biosynthesis
VVDGRSVDRTVEVARLVRADVRIVSQDRLGRNHAVATGLLYATGDVLVTLDADGSADPTGIPLLVAALSSGADYVRGSTDVGDGGWGSPRAWAGPWMRWTTGAGRELGMAGPRSCAAFWARSFTAIHLDHVLARITEDERRRKGPRIESLIQRRMARAGMHIAEVPVAACVELGG